MGGVVGSPYHIAKFVHINTKMTLQDQTSIKWHAYGLYGGNVGEYLLVQFITVCAPKDHTRHIMCHENKLVRYRGQRVRI